MIFTKRCLVTKRVCYTVVMVITFHYYIVFNYVLSIRVKYVHKLIIY